ncbi:MAG TPA: hypothetical protein VGX25_17900 [Actinophytocola sp.]|uniref:hypothetical protein n=1 Tax=Actinophytocola sp. TaxID=1872138 RepID=UPI002DDCE3BC|nr:hypothetical protein [Actinophytocola sp.]HEV2781259.1 hypothetical protein [Actinophytocola sp.]
MSNTVGYVLLAAAAVPLVLAWDMSRRGLKEVKDASGEAKDAATEALAVVAKSQEITAATTGADAQALAARNAEIVGKTQSVGDAIGKVDDALKTLTGPLAPARVFFAIALLLIVAALFGLGVIDVSAGTSTP